MVVAAPVLSVVVACHRSEAHIVECLDSILDHTRQDIEVVAVNDASPDRTGEILRARAEADPRITVLDLAINVGPGPARNVGIEHASGDYVWFVDADDSLPPASVPVVLDRLAVHEPDLLLVDHAEVFDDAEVRRRTTDALDGRTPTGPIGLADHPALLHLAQSACTKIIRRDLLLETGLRFPPGRYEDALFSPLVLMAAKTIDVLDHVCYRYRQNTTSSFTARPSATHFDVFDQYARLFAGVDEAAGALDAYRPRLFRIMIDHYLVILGHRSRVPPALRRRFFDQVVDDYSRRRPPDGYPTPGGIGGIKHAMVRLHSYPAYATFRWAYRLLPRRSPARLSR